MKNDYSELNTYDEVIINVECLEDSTNKYKENIREFFKDYKDEDFNGVINRCEIHFKGNDNITLFPCELVMGWQLLPLKAVTTFCTVFEYYLPSITINEVEDQYSDDVQVEYTYVFKKKP